MREGWTLKIYLMWLLAFLLFSSSANAGELKFPLTNDVCPTSSFGSYRSGHLHGGMDFSTGGVTGVPVLAVDSCWVWRIRIWNGGYGKALYTQLPDGKIAVYGHLSRFTAEIDSVVEAEQDLKGSYEVELYFDVKRLNFAPGDTLAFSGDTGSGPPHLHFELRSGKGDHSKINPVPDYLDVREELAPTIRRIRLAPLSAVTAIDGQYGSLILNRDDTEDTLTISGPFGVSVSAVDHAQCGKVITPVAYEAWVDGYAIWQFHLDRFPFSKSSIVGGLYDVVEGEKHMRLFDSYNLDLTGFSMGPADRFSSLWLAEGHHQLVIKVLDAWGNSDSVRLALCSGRLPEFTFLRIEDGGSAIRAEARTDPVDCDLEMAYRSGGTGWQVVPVSRDGDTWIADIEQPDSVIEVRSRARILGGFEREAVLALGGAMPESIDVETVIHSGFIEVFARSTWPPSELPTAVIPGHQSEGVHILQPAGANVFRMTCAPLITEPVTWIKVQFVFGGTSLARSVPMILNEAKQGCGFVFKGEHFAVSVDASEEYSSSTWIELKEDRGAVLRGFEAVKGRLVFEPRGTFLNGGLNFRVTALSKYLSDKHGLFLEDGEWPTFLGRFDTTGTCRVTLRKLGTLVILEDLEPPEIKSIGRFRRRSHDGKATFVARITDTGSGVEAGTVQGYVDGDVAIVGIDPDTGRVTGRTRKPLQYGRHTIRLEAEDRLGNLTVREVVLDLSR